MNSVTHFVRQGELAVKSVLMVQQDVRVYPRACGIRSAALALVFVDVYPAVLDSLAEYRAVILAHRRQGVVDLLLCLVERDLDLDVAYDRRIEVVGVQLVNAEQLLAQLHVLIHVIHVFVNRLDKLLVYLNRYLVAAERCLEGAFVSSRPCVERQALDLGSKHRCGGILEVLVNAVKALERGFSQRAVVGMHERDIAAVSYLVLVSVLIDCVRELHIGVVKH